MGITIILSLLTWTIAYFYFLFGYPNYKELHNIDELDVIFLYTLGVMFITAIASIFEWLLDFIGDIYSKVNKLGISSVTFSVMITWTVLILIGTYGIYSDDSKDLELVFIVPFYLVGMVFIPVISYFMEWWADDTERKNVESNWRAIEKCKAESRVFDLKEDIEHLKKSIELVQTEITANEKRGFFWKEAKIEAQELNNFIEKEMSKIELTDDDFLDKHNVLINLITEEIEKYE